MQNTINELPDELLLKILSLLHTKHAIATSVLSKRWRSLWKELKTCRYDGITPLRNFLRFTTFICTRSTVESMHLMLYPYSTKTDINPIINMAVKRYLRELRINTVYGTFELPKSLYFSSQLETLILEKLTLVDVPSDVCLTCLKRLHLLSVRFSSDESLKTFLSICPSLEDLVVKRSYYTNVMIFTIDTPKLRSLSIDYSGGKSPRTGVHGFAINAPSLKYFRIRDTFSNYLQFENMPVLVKASVNVVCEQYDKFLGSLTSTQYLSLCSVVTSKTQYPLTPSSFLFLNHLEFYSCSAEWWNLLIRILNDSPRLRVLKLYQRQYVQYNDDGMDPWNQLDSVPECLSSHLDIFEWRHYKGTKQERQAAIYILANACCLKEATFYSDSAEKHGILKELECVPRGSKTCQLVFV